MIIIKILNKKINQIKIRNFYFILFVKIIN